jgi:hypothetical protein
MNTENGEVQFNCDQIICLGTNSRHHQSSPTNLPSIDTLFEMQEQTNGGYVGNFKRGRFRSPSRNQKSIERDYLLCFVAQCNQNRSGGSSR